MVAPGIAVTSTGLVVWSGGSRCPLRIATTEALQSRPGLRSVAPCVGRRSRVAVAGGGPDATMGAAVVAEGAWRDARPWPPRRTSSTCASHCSRADGGSEAESLLEPAQAKSVCLSIGESGRGREGPCAPLGAGGKVATWRRGSSGSSTGDGGRDGGVASAGLAAAPDCKPRIPARSSAGYRPPAPPSALLEEASPGPVRSCGGLGGRQLTQQRENRLGPSVRGSKGSWHVQQLAYLGPPSARRLPDPLPGGRVPAASDTGAGAAPIAPRASRRGSSRGGPAPLGRRRVS